jgi:23S rRNA (pseudouridine1915-N3)-methyltransferase
MNFRIFLVGGKIEKFYNDAMGEYGKRLGRYCKIDFVHVKNPSQLSKKLTDKFYRIAVSTKGQPVSSEGLAEKVKTLALTGRPDVAFIIGAEDFPHDEIIAIGPMDMGPGLMAVIMFEQTYRAFRILNGEPYHK